MVSCITPPEPERISLGADLPGLVWRGKGTGARPAIMSVQGGGGHKGDMDLALVERAIQRGITFVTIDAYRHGERPDAIRTVNGIPQGLTLPVLVSVIERTVHNLFAVIDTLQKDRLIDDDRIGLHGGSMGGYDVLFAASIGVPVRALVSVCGAADYLNTFAWSLETASHRDPREQANMRRRLPQLDPITRVEALPPRATLMIHGEYDANVPIAGARALYEALTPLYRDWPEDCVFLTHAGGHDTPMEVQLMRWDC